MTKSRYFWPLCFVVMWSSGPIATKIALADSSPLFLLALRSALATLVLFIIVRCVWTTASFDTQSSWADWTYPDSVDT